MATKDKLVNLEVLKAVHDHDAQQIGELTNDVSTKAEQDGYYENMTVGDAEQLVATQYVADSEPYTHRTSGGTADIGNRAYLDKIVGGTVAWNQICQGMRASGTLNGLTFILNDDGSLDITGKVTTSFGQYNLCSFTELIYGFIRDGRKYLILLNQNLPFSWGVNGYSTGPSERSWSFFTSTDGGTWNNTLSIRIYLNDEITVTGLRVSVFDLTEMFGTTIADYIYSLETATPGAGVAWFRKLFPADYYPYNPGELLSVSGVSARESVGFNLWDKTKIEDGYINDTTGIVSGSSTSKNTGYVPVIGGMTYYIKTAATSGLWGAWYDADKNYISACLPKQSLAYKVNAPLNAAYLRMTIIYNNNGDPDTFCINLSWSGTRDGEYAPYEKHTYPLDSTLTLRGIPKLDAQNNLYYDGDEYLPDGTVNRRYGVVDLGTLRWTYYSSTSNGQYFYADPRDVGGIKWAGSWGSVAYPMICSRYKSVARTGSTFIDKTITVDGYVSQQTVTQIQIKDTEYSDAESFKAAMNGVMLVYELATPTTETADPYQPVQIVDDWGTEEFVTTGIVPVGHSTRYPANLRDKLQHLPDLASTDGYYMINQVGSEMSLIQFRIPQATGLADGAYTLKATVSGGTPTYTWEADTNEG